MSNDVPTPRLRLTTPQEPDWKRFSFWLMVTALALNGAQMLEFFPPGSPQSKVVLLGIFVLNGLGYLTTRTTLKKAG